MPAQPAALLLTIVHDGLDQRLVVVGLDREHAAVGPLVLKTVERGPEGGLHAGCGQPARHVVTLQLHRVRASCRTTPTFAGRAVAAWRSSGTGSGRLQPAPTLSFSIRWPTMGRKRKSTGVRAPCACSDCVSWYRSSAGPFSAWRAASSSGGWQAGDAALMAQFSCCVLLHQLASRVAACCALQGPTPPRAPPPAAACKWPHPLPA